MEDLAIYGGVVEDKSRSNGKRVAKRYPQKLTIRTLVFVKGFRNSANC
jgi:hypothetical protein